MKFKLMVSLIVVLSYLFFSCNNGSSIDPYTIGNISIDYNSIEPVYEIDFGSDDELTINLSGTFSGQDMFLVKMNLNDSVIDSVNAGYVKSENVNRSLVISGTNTTPSFESINPVKKDHIASMAFLTQYHLEEDSGIFIPSRSMVPEKEEYVDYGEIVYTEGTSTKTFYVEDETGVFISIPTTLRSLGNYAYIWVADINYDDSPGTTTDNLIRQSQIDNLAEKFNDTSGVGSAIGIYELVTKVFGYEYGGGPNPAVEGGKDEDKHINILIYDIDYDYIISQTGGVYGYFWGKDYYDDAFAQTWIPALRSNESEIFYIDSHFLDLDENGIYSTLAHEFQHMIHFNKKALENNLGSETWYNEMLSMLAEDILQDKLGNLDPASPKSRTRDFVDGYYLSGVTDWLSGNDVYYSYASSFMFGAFMTRNFGGPDLIKAMMDNNSVNQKSVTDALVSIGAGTASFDAVFDKYHTALIYNMEDLPDDILVINTPPADPFTVSSNIGGVTYNQKAFDIYDYNNSYTGDPGPVVISADYKLALRPRGMSIHSDGSWFDLNGINTLNFNIVAPVPGVKYYLMFRPSP